MNITRTLFPELIKYLQECCDFVHELEDIPQVHKGNIEYSPSKHEHDGVQVLDLWVVHHGGNHQVGADHQHHNGNDYGTLKYFFDIKGNLRFYISSTLYGLGSLGSLYLRTMRASMEAP